MKKTLLTFIALGLSAIVSAQEIDSLRLEQLQEVVVKGVRAQKDAPFAIANIKKKELDAKRERNCLSFSHKHQVF